MDKSPLCTCLIKQDLEEAADPYEFLDKNYSISGILDNLDKLSPRELKCACCLFGVALQKACKKKGGGRGWHSIVCLYKKHGGSVMRQIKSGLILKKCSMIVMHLYIILLIFANVFKNITF